MKIQTTESIRKIKNPSTEEFLDIWKQYQPFLIEDVAEHWDACQKWSNDYLIKHCGNNIVNIRLFKKDFLNDYKNFASEDGYVNMEKTVKYKEYINDYIEKEKGN
ncbi:cupin-like domain-containing protein [Nostoc favosum]|uniref:Cupin-like domain-containing protein n=1 Tax=Nostoc favosum CHAB5714 TaxID=2780399 RepID=A0ABS8IHN8_9NOSO|nr:cupin-like domain-containing protein [Nostoc favosum]MCC5603394.1 cupin-like domain-containing protein [Nostoc favosum CHAB5714]